MSSGRNIAAVETLKDSEKVKEAPRTSENTAQKLQNYQTENLEREVSTKGFVHINFPRPTLISNMLSRLAKAFEYTFVMEPKLDRRVQVFSPGPVASGEAFKIFAASLGAVGLRLIFVNETTIKIAEKPSLTTRV